MGKPRLPFSKRKIAEFCKRWGIVEFCLFGSVLRDDFNPDSDIDVLVTFMPDAQVSLFDMVQMQLELKVIFSHDVDLVEKASLKNPYRRNEILQTAKRVYAS
jgi:predicted nucleotidyltransferase